MRLIRASGFLIGLLMSLLLSLTLPQGVSADTPRFCKLALQKVGLLPTPPLIELNYLDIVPASVRRVGFGVPPNWTNYHLQGIDAVAIKLPDDPAFKPGTYGALFVVSGEDIYRRAFFHNLRRRFHGLMQDAVYMDQDGVAHKGLILTGSSNRNTPNQGMESLAAEALIAMSLDTLLTTVQELQRRNKAGIPYAFRASPAEKDSWGFINGVFRVPIMGGSEGNNWLLHERRPLPDRSGI